MTTAILPNVNAPNVLPINVPLDTLLSENTWFINPGSPIFTLLFQVPTGVYVELWLNGRYPLILDEGSSSYKTDIDCVPYVGGYALKTYTTYPGLKITGFIGAGVRTA